MKLKNKKIIITLLLLTTITSIMIYKYQKTDKIDRVLLNSSYSYLPKEAKNYIKKVYEKTGQIIYTEKNKEEDKPYLNPKYIEYLEMSNKEKSQIELIPDTYIVDYQTKKNYETEGIPDKYDLRNQDGKTYVSSIKNQGNTGICWAFASIENVETLIMKQKAQSYSDLIPKFSIRQMDYVTATDKLVRKADWSSCCEQCSCSYYNWDNPDNGSRKLDNGGNFYTSSIVMSNGLTLTDESVLPWTESKTPKWPKEIMGYDKSLYEVNSTIQMNYIDKDNADSDEINSYVNDIKRYMIQYGGPFVGTLSPQSTCGFENAIDGKKAMKIDDCSNESSNKTKGHAMQIIGWDDDYRYSYCDAGTTHYSVSNGSCTKGQLVEGTGAWILRNSWGEDTEDARNYRYVYLTYDSTRLSIGFTTSLSEMSSRTWDNNYHSNPWIDGDSTNGLAYISSQTEEFKTNNDKPEKIEKIKFMTPSKNAKFYLSVMSDSKTYSNIATINSEEMGIYTVDLSNKNIILNDMDFSVKIESENNDYYIVNDSISVFTSNIEEEEHVTTYSSKAYDAEKPLSDNNPLYIYLYYNSYQKKYSWNVSLKSYLKNIPQYSDLNYRLKKDETVLTNFATKTLYYEGDIAIAEFEDEYSELNIPQNKPGDTWTMEVLYNNQVVNSFPIKFNDNGHDNNSKSNVRLYSNHGSSYYYDYAATDNQVTKFSDLNGNANFYNNGYYITGWNTKADGSGTSYDADNGVLVYHDMELYAQWSTERLQVEVVYVGDDSECYKCSSGTMPSQFYGYYDVIELPVNTFEADGYVFKGWKIVANNTIERYEQEKTSSKISELLTNPIFNNLKIMVYATWTNNAITINFDANGGTGNMKSINVQKELTYGGLKSNRIKSNLFTKNGYVFKEWNTKADGSGTSYNNNSYIQSDSDITLYAQWSESPTITFYANDGTNTKKEQTVGKNVSTRLDANTFTRTGYVFKEWNTKADGTGTKYTDKKSVSISENLVLYAQWEIPITEVKVSPSDITLGVGDTKNLKIEILPKNTTMDKTITWTTGNGVASVTNGKIKGLVAGQTILTATTSNGKTAQIIVTVKDTVNFNDVQSGDWYYESVRYVNQNNIILGYNETTFAPHDKVTRGQLVTILWRLEQTPNTDNITNHFSDVNENDYYGPGVKWAMKNDIVHGHGGTTKFGPNEPIIRQDLAVILNNYARYKGLEANTNNNLGIYSDKDLVIGGYAETAIKWATANKVINGMNMPDGTVRISPHSNASRAETAAMISNMITKFDLL